MSAEELPVFELEVIASDVRFEARVNDVPVLRMPAGRVVTAFDVSPYVEDGDNTLSLAVRPRAPGQDFGDDAACSLAIRRRTSPDPASGETLGVLVFSGYGVEAVTGFERSIPARGAGAVLVERPSAKGTLRFFAETPFGPWAWAGAAELSPTEALRAEVLLELMRIHALLERRDAGALESVLAIQAADYRRAYELSSLEEAHARLGVRALLADPDTTIEPFPASILTLELFGGGRLVELVDPEGKSPLVVRSRAAPELVGRFQCVLCKLDGAWQIAR